MPGNALSGKGGLDFFPLEQFFSHYYSIIGLLLHFIR